MPKYMHDDILDAPLDKIIADSDRLVWFKTFSTDYATIVANEIGEYVPTFAKANGDVSGRKLTVQPVADVNITATGDFEHWALLDDDGTKVLHVGTGTLKPFTLGDSVDAPAVDIEFADPT